MIALATPLPESAFVRITPPTPASGTKKKLLLYPNIEPPWLMTRTSLMSSIHSPMPYQELSPVLTCETRRASRLFSLTNVEPSGSRPRASSRRT